MICPQDLKMREIVIFFLLHINFETHFDKIYKKAAGRVNWPEIHPIASSRFLLSTTEGVITTRSNRMKFRLRVNLLRRIRPSIDTLCSAQRIYQSMIMSIFTYCSYKSLGWSESRKSMIRSMLRNEASKSFPRNAVRRTAIFDF